MAVAIGYEDYQMINFLFFFRVLVLVENLGADLVEDPEEVGGPG